MRAFRILPELSVIAVASLAAGLWAGRRRVESVRSSDLAAAHALSREVGGLVDMEEVYCTAVSHLSRRMRGEGVAILRVIGPDLVLVAAEGPLRIASGYVQSRDDGLLGLAVRSGQPVTSDDVQVDDRAVRAPGMEHLRSEIALPICDRDGRVHAVLDVTSIRPGRFGSAEVSLLGTAVAALEGAVTAASLYGQVAERAATDPLTGLPNHRTFQERLADAVDAARHHRRPLSLCLVDLDRFKEINDSRGHQEGDATLARAARALQAHIRHGETLARIGGDEFAWIICGADGRAAWVAAERARAAVARALDASGVTLSAGICDLSDAVDSDDLFRLADGALYWAKAQGRDLSVLYAADVVKSLSAEERAAQAERCQALKGLRALARAVDAKDPSTRDHSERVAGLAVCIARQLGWPDDAVARLREAAVLHDVGKIGIPDAVLLKPGPLEPHEHEIVRSHAALGAQIAAEVLGEEQVAWVRGHHERVDGEGYPDRLRGEQIPEGARILAVADTWDAMTSDRVHRPARTTDDAVHELARSAGGQLCARVVAALQAALGLASSPSCGDATVLVGDAPP